MKIFYAPKSEDLNFEQVGIEGNAEDYVKLGEIVKVGGRFETDVSGNPWPYDSFLSAFEIRVVPESKVLVQAKGTELWIEGSTQFLDVLGDNMAEYGIEAGARRHESVTIKYHQHIDYFEGHYFLAEGSVELILNHE